MYRQSVLMFCITTACMLLSHDAALANNAFNIYCTSNFDGTGDCKTEKEGEDLECIVVPGGIIACRNMSDEIFECVLFGEVIAAQAQFSCKPDQDGSSKSQFKSWNKPGSEASPKEGSSPSTKDKINEDEIKSDLLNPIF